LEYLQAPPVWCLPSVEWVCATALTAPASLSDRCLYNNKNTYYSNTYSYSYSYSYDDDCYCYCCCYCYCY